MNRVTTLFLVRTGVLVMTLGLSATFAHDGHDHQLHEVPRSTDSEVPELTVPPIIERRDNTQPTPRMPEGRLWERERRGGTLSNGPRLTQPAPRSDERSRSQSAPPTFNRRSRYPNESDWQSFDEFDFDRLRPNRGFERQWGERVLRQRCRCACDQAENWRRSEWPLTEYRSSDLSPHLFTQPRSDASHSIGTYGRQRATNFQQPNFLHRFEY